MKLKRFFVLVLVLICMPLAAPVKAVTVIDRIVAVVNDDIITLVELNRQCAPYLPKLQAGGYSQAKKDAMLKDLHQRMLDVLVDKALVQQESKRYNIEVTENEIDNSVNNLLTSKSMSLENLKQALAQDQMTYEGYRENIRDQILQNKLINHAVKSKVAIPESEIKAYYDAHEEEYAGHKKYHLRHILNQSESKIKDVKAALDAGTPFEELARKFSESANAEDGGDLGVFDITSFSDDIKRGIESVGPGDYTGVMNTHQGYQIFFVESVNRADGKTLEAVHDEIHERLYRQAVSEKFDTWLASLKEQAHIEIRL